MLLPASSETSLGKLADTLGQERGVRQMGTTALIRSIEASKTINPKDVNAIAVATANRVDSGVAERLKNLIPQINDGVGDKLKSRFDEVVGLLNTTQTTIKHVLNYVVLPQPTAEAFECLRVVNQVEDLILDKSFNPARNNKSLADIRDPNKNGAYKQCLELLKDSGLCTAFQEIFRDFTEKESKNFLERPQRFLEIQRLRAEIVRYFGKGKSL